MTAAAPSLALHDDIGAARDRREYRRIAVDGACEPNDGVQHSRSRVIVPTVAAESSTSNGKQAISRSLSSTNRKTIVSRNAVVLG